MKQYSQQLFFAWEGNHVHQNPILANHPISDLCNILSLFVTLFQYPIIADLSTLDLGNIDESRDELDFMLNVTSTDKLGQTSIYYTMDSRRMASKHKKNQQDR